MGQRRVPAGVTAWFLVIAAALPIAVIIRLGWKVMTGSADDLTSQGPALTGLDLLGDRWSRLWMIESVPLLPLMTLLPLTLLAVLVVADRPRVLVPTALSRFLATFVAVTTALLGLIEGVGVICQVLGVLPGLSWGGVMGSQVEVYAPIAAMAVTTTVMGAAAASLLWPRRGDQLPHAEINEQTDSEEADQNGTDDDRTADEAVPDVVMARPALHQSAQELPAPTATDLDLYRRR